MNNIIIGIDGFYDKVLWMCMNCNVIKARDKGDDYIYFHCECMEGDTEALHKKLLIEVEP